MRTDGELASPRLRLALCQMNATVGDIDGNAQRIAAGIADARTAGAELVLFPELALTGYPPEDLLLRVHFLSDTGKALHELASQTQGIVAVVGFPERAQAVYNAAAVLQVDKYGASIARSTSPTMGSLTSSAISPPATRAPRSTLATAA